MKFPMFLAGKKPDNEQIVVPDRVRNRAEKALSTGEPRMWIDQTLYLIGSNVAHHKDGDPLLDEAITSAQALLALLVTMKEREQP